MENEGVIPIFTLKRIAFTTNGVFGVLLDGRTKTPFALTLERPWLNNQRGISCIPTDNYICVRKNSPKFGDTFEVKHVENRSHILFHKGNLSDDSHGCILVGEEFGVLGGRAAILSSGRGFGEFKERLRAKGKFLLRIVGCY